MQESAIAVSIFWFSFVFSIGPFWIGVMEAAKKTPISQLFKQYLIYQLVGWFPVIVVIGLLVGILGKINEDIFTVMYFLGAVVIFNLAYKTLKVSGSKKEKFNFNWKEMVLITWVNPKVWLTIPVGFLAANFTQSLLINILLYFIICFPLAIAAFFMWAMIGKKGAKYSKNILSYFNASLLALFGLYLFYEGLKKVNI